GRLRDGEAALLGHGWEGTPPDAYDKRYSRPWMHELPPMQHRERGTVIDVHHNILPETARWRPDPRLLLAAARPLADPQLRVLAPADMVLHSAAHLFQEGELENGLRDLTDLDALLRHFGAEAGFWDQLVPRPRALGLERTLFYALRYARRLLQTPVPGAVWTAAQAGGPAGAVRRLMDGLVERALLPEPDDAARWGTWLARGLLFVRGHWLRMPPLLL